MAKPPLLYQVSGRTLEVYRTPRAYATTQSGRDSYLAGPPPVHETSSDARSWSRQTEGALDAYREEEEKRRTVLDQTVRVEDAPTVGRGGSYEMSHGTEKKTGVEVTEYRLYSGNSDVLGSSRVLESSQRSEKSASSYFATYIEAAQLEADTEQTLEAAQKPPKNHRMTKMIVKEDIDFFTALLEGHDPPTTTEETRTFVRDESETHRHSLEIREREADRRRQEEAEAAKADTDFFMMLMCKE
ncbi:hypothetical protein INS49_012464 [Diaporthe citri]|uniref:uncharacterized protein n=1 Tax=Diaporthe citri TaxID=83186 RepID=UPI001C81C9BC|nr:uncharacterized protein INS49_012464 [Diaporthe citri]KAG6358944.1 hypothetical protein INS49_012464 [Diaporthe citri]